MPTKTPKLKYNLKNLYCPTDRRLVRVKEVKANGELTLVCTRCGSVLWHQAGAGWRSAEKPLADTTKSRK